MNDHRDRSELILTLTAHLTDTLSVPVTTSFCYAAYDPYAISLNFVDPRGHLVTWVIARDLLADGLLTGSGEGDVVVRPPAPCGHMEIELRNHGRKVVFVAEADQLITWLATTYDLVPEGTESAWIDWDRHLAHLTDPQAN